MRTRADGACHDRQVWLVELRLEGAHEEPWWRVTARPATTAAEALEIFRMYRQRWSIEDAFNTSTTTRLLGTPSAEARARLRMHRRSAATWLHGCSLTM